MPLLVILAVIAILFALTLLVIPFSIVQRYRAGTARRRARRWAATINVFAFTVSATILLFVAALSGPWVPNAVAFVLAGLGAGALLGVLGLLLTRWTPGPRGLEYQPSRWLVLTITLVVLARLGYGFVRAWNAWQSSGDGSWLAEAGAAGSMGAGAVVVGYYLIYWGGLRRKTRPL